MSAIVITLAGEPRGKERPRFAGHAYTASQTRDYEAALAQEGRIAMGGHAPLDGPLSVLLHAFFAVPSSWSAKRRAAALAGTIKPTIRPDFDNLAKTLDALNKIVWRDDAQIVTGTVTKSYSEPPRIEITVKPL